MNMSTSGSNGRLRRSSRAPKKSNTEYSVGDVVEIQRNNGTSHARLVQLLTEGTVSPNPRWLIRSISNSKDEEVYEHSFIGKISEKNRDDMPTNTDEQNASDDVRANESPVLSDPPDETTMSETSRLSKKKKTSHSSTDNANGIDSTMNSDSSVVRKGATNRNKSSSTSTTSKASTKHAMSASSREARSRRRGQSVPDKDSNVQQEQYDGVGSTESLMQQPETSVPATTDTSLQQQRKRKLTGAAKISVDTKRERESKTTKVTTNATTSTSISNNKKEEEECVKIKFLTGTLYLYRGKRRRAEFIRRV